MYFSLVLWCNTQFTLVNGILGGYDVDITEAPYQVNYGDICGGVLIHNQYALTTAHCGKEYFIRLGSKYRQKSPKIIIRQHIVHPYFSRKHEFDFDIQLLNFRTLRFTKSVHPIEISKGECGNYIYVTGWGFPKEKSDFNEVLKRARLHIVSRIQCQMVQQPWYNHSLTTRMFCAEGKEEDACQGDSGGPAVSFGRLVGLSSFGYGCGRVPGVYLNVSDKYIRKWIKKHAGV
ncbi:trypsin-1-like isoform X2 [Choristoneura fumiferana]|uniref:trypsin-1-like isoform X2 n=1 Tax=Choristoneura fumiferana TaxID=7141 RepID=UPI003D156D63